MINKITRAHTDQDPTAATFQSLPPEIVMKILSYVVTMPHDIRVLTQAAQRRLRDSIDRPKSLSSSLAVLLVCRSFHECALPIIFKRNRIVFPSVDGQSPTLATDSTIGILASVSPDGSPRV